MTLKQPYICSLGQKNDIKRKILPNKKIQRTQKAAPLILALEVTE